MSNDKERNYLAEPAAAYIWKALLRDNPSGALAIIRVIISGNAAIVYSGRKIPVPFNRADVYDELKLREFLEQKPYHHDVDALLEKYPPTDTPPNFHQMLMNTISGLVDEGEKQKYYSLFFTTDQIVEEKKTVVHGDTKRRVELASTSENLTDVYTDFLEKGKLLGISPVMMSIILPESARQQLLMELLNKLQSQKSEGH